MAVKIALAGNPNSGKTTLFNALTGSNQYVGNWPGVTVEKKEGAIKWEQGENNEEAVLVDLPGVYSLSPYTMEEVVSRNFLLEEKPSAIINIVDGSNIERNLYLTTQLTELGIPVIVAINMMDVIRRHGDTLDTEKLAKMLGCEVVEISALKSEGIRTLAQRAVSVAKSGKIVTPHHSFGGLVEHTLAHIEEAVLHDLPEERQRWFAIKLFERDKRVIEKLGIEPSMLAHIEGDIKKCEDALDDDSESIITNERYNYVATVIEACYVRKNKGLTGTDKIDRVLTNRWLALPIFAAIMFIVYYVSVTTVGAFLTDWTTDVLFGTIISDALTGFLNSVHCAAWLQSLVVDGILGGVGGVLGFVPQMFVLFFFLAILESCGYMSRIAFIMDKIFRKFGLSGKSFIPILIGTGCSVPGIMASRTIESDLDRRMTVITTSFIPCGAKLPVIALIAGALLDGAWWVAPSAYFIGIAAVVFSGIVLKKTRQFSGEPAPFVMELPAYHMPTAKSVWQSMWERGWAFIKKAGTIILLSAVLIWFTSNFGFVGGHLVMVENLSRGILATFGDWLSPLFAPLGFGNWESVVAVLTGLVAKENIVSTFGVLFGFAEGGTGTLTQHFSALSGYTFLLFNLLCAPCVAAIGAIRREMHSGAWTWYAIGYQTLLAYAVSFCVYQIGSALSGGGWTIGTALAILTVALLLHMLLRRPTRIRGRR